MFATIKTMKHSKYTYRIPVLIALLTIVVGSVFYHYVEDFSWVDAYYFTIGTMFTVGYGDFAPVTELGKIFTTFYMVVGVGIIGGLLRVAIQHRVEHSSLNADHKHHDVDALSSSSNKTE